MKRQVVGNIYGKIIRSSSSIVFYTQHFFPSRIGPFTSKALVYNLPFAFRSNKNKISFTDCWIWWGKRILTSIFWFFCNIFISPLGFPLINHPFDSYSKSVWQMFWGHCSRSKRTTTICCHQQCLPFFLMTPA